MKRMKRKSIIVLLSVLFILSGVLNVHSAPFAEKPYYDNYNEVLDDIGGEYIEYTVFDINNDGIYELLVDYGGSDGARCFSKIYNKIIMIGSCGCNSRYYEKNGKLFSRNVTIVHNNYHSYWLNRLDIVDNTLVETTVIAPITVPRSNDSTPAEIPYEIKQYLANAKEQYFAATSDRSLLNNITEISVYLNNRAVLFDQPPIIKNDRTLVPLRAIFEALGATVDWNENAQTVTSSKVNTTIKITIGDNKLYVNNNKIVLDVPAQIVGDRTLVPVRAVSEAFGCKVDWDEDSQTVYIASK